MIRFYYHPTPNPAKIALFLEETGLPYEAVPVDTSKGEQHTAEFRAINPNGKVPAIVDTDGPGHAEVRVFDSTAILLYLSEKTGQLMGSPADRGELLSWLLYIATGLGPFSGQAVHFQRAAPEKLPNAINRYRREAERHYAVLDKHLEGRNFIVGSDYTIADISAWGWIDRASFVLPGSDDPLAAYPNIKRWFQAINDRSAVAKARSVSSGHAFKKAVDDESRRALFPSNYPPAAA
ncbi:MAG: glutathione S-transferase C-terminal domain-containing protein [Xanthobacteraceae bacterium]